jgi:cell division septation protein DedD
MAAVEPVTAPIAAAVEAAVDSVVDTVINFVSIPVIQPLRNAASQVMAAVTPEAAPAAAPARVAAVRRTGSAAEPQRARGPVQTTGWAVQLGAYDSNAIARENWSRLARRHAALSARDGVSTVATVGGRSFYRLAATGYASRAEAVSACASIARVGGNCFVRQMTSADRVQWASRPVSTRIAAAAPRTRIASR